MINNKEIRKKLIERYLDAETTVEEERRLAAYFSKKQPEKEEEDLALMLEILQDGENKSENLLSEEGEKEYSKIISKAYIKRARPFAFAFLGCAAAIALFVIFLSNPHSSVGKPDSEEISFNEILYGLNVLAELNTEETESIYCTPIGGGQIVTLQMKNGEKASYLMITEGSQENIRFTAIGNNYKNF